MQISGPIGVFDSGYGGLSILREIHKHLPQADYIYLGDNARAPYGTRSFDLVYEFTLQAVKELFSRGCNLVILACNTASAKALRSIQQRDLPAIDPDRRVLGVIRPTAEAIGQATKSRSVGLFATPGTVASQSYDMEIGKLYPDVEVHSHACPMWVPLVENLETNNPGADYFIKKDIDSLFGSHKDIDTLILGCTHYPLLLSSIERHVPKGTKILNQGEITAISLKDYLKRHPEINRRITRNGTIQYFTTEHPDKFNTLASVFMGRPVEANKIVL